MPILTSKTLKIFGLILGIILVVISTMISIVYGFTEISWKTAVDAMIQYDESSQEHIIIQTSRMPRALIAATIGASMAIASALMQALTRNPLADPSVLGINAGAVFFVVFSISFFSVSSVTQFAWIAFIGAGMTSAIVYVIGSLGRDGLTPMKIVLSGAAINALFISFTQGLLVMNENQLEQILFWLTGSVAGRTLDMLQTIAPYLLIGWVAAFLIAKPMNLFMIGEDVAKGLGQRTFLTKLFTTMVFVVLAGSSVAVAGPLAFFGVVIPPMARYLVGLDYRWVIPYCGLIGAILLLLADIAARFIAMPQEIPVGAMTALIGGPFFIYIARRGLSKA